MNQSSTLDQSSKTDHVHMPPDHMERLYTSKEPLVSFIHVGRLSSIVREVPHKGQLDLLDAGCGEGHLLQKLYQSYPGHHYHGLDITEVALVKAGERCPFANFKQADLTRTGFPDEFFDVIVCTEVIEHIYEYATVLKELKRILKKGGHLILTFPNEPVWTLCRFFLGRRPVKVPDHVNSFRPETMKAAVGLKLETQRNLPFGLPFALSLNCVMKFKKEAS